MAESVTCVSWTNWARNQAFDAIAIRQPENEEQAIDMMSTAIRRKQPVRVAGGGHSFSPIVETTGELFDLSKVAGLLSANKDTGEVVVGAGATLASLGDPLWSHGLSLANQGDINVQSVAGAIATGTKGSALQTGSMSATVTSLKIVNGLGDVVEIDATTPDLLRAGRVSLGLLGPIVRVGLRTVPAYRLSEDLLVMSMQEVRDRWDELLARHHHFSFWWMPTERSHEMYVLPKTPKDHCFVKLLKKLPVDGSEDPGSAGRVDRSYRIYPDGTTEAKFHELEYMVPSTEAQSAMAAIQWLMQNKFPDEISPLQIRWQKADDGFISPQGERDSTSLSVSGEIGRNYWPFLKAVDETLRPFGGRPHWGKIHFLDADQARIVYPEFEQFQKVRRAMDPHGLFLNEHLSALFR